eukprot:TRINITY_DN9406_c0_g1_i1.p1 TRINITY_DN9406_c0_g1~~TRINITY_DN9406_c0_g1_i1.p1  ORF type:complete len:580 (-),score=120.07 TRINITY_DN9406_c0_g1_i1:16-1716(-)
MTQRTRRRDTTTSSSGTPLFGVLGTMNDSRLFVTRAMTTTSLWLLVFLCCGVLCLVLNFPREAAGYELGYHREQLGLMVDHDRGFFDYEEDEDDDGYYDFPSKREVKKRRQQADQVPTPMPIPMPMPMPVTPGKGGASSPSVEGGIHALETAIGLDSDELEIDTMESHKQRQSSSSQQLLRGRRQWRDEDERHAIVTMATDSKYVVQARVLANSLKASGSTTELVCLITQAVDQQEREDLLLEFDRLIEVEEIHTCPKNTRYCLNDRPYKWAYWTKIRIWDLTEYSRVLWMGSDMVALYNPDELFECSPLPCAAADSWLVGYTEFGPVINGDLLVIQPNRTEGVILQEEVRRWVTRERAERAKYREIEDDAAAEALSDKVYEGAQKALVDEAEKIRRRHCEEFTKAGWWLGPMDQALLNKRYRRRFTILSPAWNFVFTAVQKDPFSHIDIFNLNLSIHTEPLTPEPISSPPETSDTDDIPRIDLISEEDFDRDSAPIRILHYAGKSKPWMAEWRTTVKQLEKSGVFKTTKVNPNMAVGFKLGKLMKLWLDLEKEVLEKSSTRRHSN